MDNNSTLINTSVILNGTDSAVTTILQPVVNLTGPVTQCISILLLAVGLAGMTLNCFTVQIMLRINQSGEESKSDRILKHIAIVDILANITITLPGAALFSFFSHIQDELNIRFGQALFTIIASVSFLNLLLQNLLSIDRVSVALKKGKELISKERLGQVLTTIWGLSGFAFLVKIYWVLKIEDKKDNFFNLYGFDSTPSESVKQHAYISLFANGITAIIVLSSFLIVHVTVRRQNRLIRNMQQQGMANVSRRKEMSISKIAIVIGLVTLVTLLPWEVYRTTKIYHPSVQIDAMIPLVYLIYCINYCINPIIYVIMVKRFKEEIKRWICCFEENNIANVSQKGSSSQRKPNE